MPGELRREELGFSKHVLLWVSPVNAGAQELADEMAQAVLADALARASRNSRLSTALPGPSSQLKTNLTVITADALPERATHMLLNLCEESWSDERLTEQALLRGGEVRARLLTAGHAAIGQGCARSQTADSHGARERPGAPRLPLFSLF